MMLFLRAVHPVPVYRYRCQLFFLWSGPVHRCTSFVCFRSILCMVFIEDEPDMRLAPAYASSIPWAKNAVRNPDSALVRSSLRLSALHSTYQVCCEEQLTTHGLHIRHKGPEPRWREVADMMSMHNAAAIWSCRIRRADGLN